MGVAGPGAPRRAKRGGAQSLVAEDSEEGALIVDHGHRIEGGPCGVVATAAIESDELRL